MDVFDAIAAGTCKPATPPTQPVPAEWLSEAELALSYALAKRVPDMARGFTISTGYGDIEVSGPLARQIQALVRDALATELSQVKRA